MHAKKGGGFLGGVAILVDQAARDASLWLSTRWEMLNKLEIRVTPPALFCNLLNVNKKNTLPRRRRCVKTRMAVCDNTKFGV